MEWRNLYRGLLMGASDVVPGVSGGTIAVILGIYEQLIEAINGFFSKDFKKHLLFLVPLGIGVVTAVFLLAGLIEWLFEHYPKQTQFAFLGLIVGVLPFLFQQAKARENFKTKHVLFLVVGACIVASMTFFRADELAPVADFDVTTYLWLFVSGFIASTAMILPGISGSLVLLIIGSYSTIFNAINELHIFVLFIVGSGIIIGILVMSKFIRYCLATFPFVTYALVIGMVIGSVFVIFPGWAEEAFAMIMCIITFVSGLLVAFLLGKVEYN